MWYTGDDVQVCYCHFECEWRGTNPAKEGSGRANYLSQTLGIESNPRNLYNVFKDRDSYLREVREFRSQGGIRHPIFGLSGYLSLLTLGLSGYCERNSDYIYSLVSLANKKGGN